VARGDITQAENLRDHPLCEDGIKATKGVADLAGGFFREVIVSLRPWVPQGYPQPESALVAWHEERHRPSVERDCGWPLSY